MSSSEGQLPPTTSVTQIILVTGAQYRVEGDVHAVERTILDAARGSIMQFAWLTESETREELAVNPDHVIVLKAAPA